MPHIHEKIDFIVDVFVVHKDTVLLRLHEKYHKWLSVGGHIELDENPNEAALREVKEEVGLEITLIDQERHVRRKDPEYKELIPPAFLNIHKINNTHQHIGMIYFATSENTHVAPERPTDTWKWFTLSELEKNELGISPEIIFYATEALRTAGGKN